MRAVTLAFVFVTPVIAAEPTADERKAAVEFLRAEAAGLPKMIALEKQLAKQKGKVAPEDLAFLRDRIKELRKVEKPEGFAPKLQLSKAGEVGTIPAQKVWVREILDKNTAIIETRTNRPAGERDQDIFLVVYGVDTSKWADDLAVDAPPGVWIVTQERRGGRTLFALHRLTLTKEEGDAIMKAAKP